MIMEILSIVCGVIFFVCVSCRGGNLFFSLSWFIDLPTLVIMAVFVVPVLLRNGLWRDFTRAFRLLKTDYTCHLSELRRTEDVIEMMQRQVRYAGILTMLIAFIYVLLNISEPAMIGPNVSVAILSLLYAVILEMLLLPLQLEVKRRIINYMSLETEPFAESGQPVAKQETAVQSETEKKTEEI